MSVSLSIGSSRAHARQTYDILILNVEVMKWQAQAHRRSNSATLEVAKCMNGLRIFPGAEPKTELQKATNNPNPDLHCVRICKCCGESVVGVPSKGSVFCEVDKVHILPRFKGSIVYYGIL